MLFQTSIIDDVPHDLNTVIYNFRDFNLTEPDKL